MAKTIASDLDFGAIARALNLPAPVSAGDAATKSYVDSLVEGLAWKDSCRVATSSNINLASPGAALDGVTMATADRVLVRGQTVASANGVYIWNGAATPMTRAADASTAVELEQAVVSVEEGTDAGTTWRQTAVNFVLDTGNVVFSSFGTSAPSASETVAGVAEIATQAETNAGTDDLRFVTPLKLKSSSFAKLKFAQNIGDGAATQFTVTHNLGTLDVAVSVFRNSGAGDEIGVDVEHTTTNSVTIRFAAGNAPTSNQYRVVVIG